MCAVMRYINRKLFFANIGKIIICTMNFHCRYVKILIFNESDVAVILSIELNWQ